MTSYFIMTSFYYASVGSSPDIGVCNMTPSQANGTTFDLAVCGSLFVPHYHPIYTCRGLRSRGLRSRMSCRLQWGRDSSEKHRRYPASEAGPTLTGRYCHIRGFFLAKVTRPREFGGTRPGVARQPSTVKQASTRR